MACTLTFGSATRMFDIPEGGIRRYELLNKARAAFSLAACATLRPQPTCALRVLEKKELAHDARVYFDDGKLFELVDARSLERDDIPNLGERLMYAGVHWFTEKCIVVDGVLESDVIARAAARPKRAFSLGSSAAPPPAPSAPPAKQQKTTTSVAAPSSSSSSQGRKPDKCAICRNSLNEPSFEYEANPSPINENGLSIAFGCCGHARPPGLSDGVVELDSDSDSDDDEDERIDGEDDAAYIARLRCLLAEARPRKKPRGA
ncbi:hypothetical protein SO694_00002017 [Aureococcus anophagefferens]|uniref:Uncharacterized protein n=1 Tax=Aureococcus anophagefferens TaxID=44056 RepID=A0ABR1GC58_AURAN